MPSVGPDLTRESFLKMQNEIIEQFRTDEFQKKLHERWAAAGDDVVGQTKAKMEVCLEVQAHILPKYGFEPTRKGVQQSNMLMSKKFSHDPEIGEASQTVAFLVNPEKQAEYLRQQQQQQEQEQLQKQQEEERRRQQQQPPQQPPPANQLSHMATVRLSREQAWAMQDELLAGLSNADFQRRLVEACRAAGSDKSKLVKAKHSVCLEVQAPIIAKYGFEASFKGVMDSLVAFQEPCLLEDPDIQVRNYTMSVLVSPQVEEPAQAEQGEIRVYREEGGSRHLVCSLTVDLSDDVRKLKQEVEPHAGMSEFSQRLLDVSTRSDLRDRQLLSTLVPAGSAVDVLLVARRPEVAEWLERLKEDRLAKKGTLCLAEAPSELLADADFILPALEQHPRTLQFAAGALRHDRRVVLAAVQEAGKVLEFASKELRADRGVVLAAVQRDGWALEFAAPALQADREVVMAAVAQDGLAFQFASEALQADRGVALCAIRGEAWAYTNASAELQADREVAITAVKEDWEVFEDLSPELRGDRELVLEAVKQQGMTLQFASPALRADRDLVLAAVRTTGQALRFADPCFLEDPEIALVAVSNDGLTFPMLAPSLRTFDLALVAAKQDLRVLSFFAAELRDQVLKALGYSAAPKMPVIGEVKDSAEVALQKKMARHFKTLGLDMRASPDEIRRRYRQLALQSHPDKHPDDPEGAKKKFQLINDAYQAIKEGMLT